MDLDSLFDTEKDFNLWRIKKRTYTRKYRPLILCNLTFDNFIFVYIEDYQGLRQIFRRDDRKIRQYIDFYHRKTKNQQCC